MISIAGGKLTGYRKMAERVVDTVTKQLGEETGKSYPECRTIAIELSGGHFGGSKHYIPFVQEQIKIGAEQGLKKETVARLVKNTGPTAAYCSTISAQIGKRQSAINCRKNCWLPCSMD
ncbi:aerobic glycerol-3-phosphate dehydrogenase [Sporolactobacillus inulinus]|uniref:Aerobic glycerol-3-phosphate dehydrogenase n=1 Tax=Sporolactobacillus inulinus TaxID=2078 RepID=A0A4Y1ZEL8_9BACL|nr:aerobic glycerol-3-phosphate dehydrogenase [Sporolactobacillus inulinus]